MKPPPPVEAIKDFAALLESLKCIVCEMICEPPIYMCSQGHTICCICIEKSEKCGVCHQPIMEKVRNLALENILANSGITKRSSSDGFGQTKEIEQTKSTSVRGDPPPVSLRGDTPPVEALMETLSLDPNEST